MTHGLGILISETIKPESITSTWQKALKDADEPEVAAAAAESLAKLMLANVITDEEILKCLVETYFNPASARNDPLKQALSYFFPVYCHSVPENQLNMAKVPRPLKFYAVNVRLRSRYCMLWFEFQRIWMRMRT